MFGLLILMAQTSSETFRQVFGNEVGGEAGYGDEVSSTDGAEEG